MYFQVFKYAKKKKLITIYERPEPQIIFIPIWTFSDTLKDISHDFEIS